MIRAVRRLIARYRTWRDRRAYEKRMREFRSAINLGDIRLRKRKGDSCS